MAQYDGMTTSTPPYHFLNSQGLMQLKHDLPNLKSFSLEQRIANPNLLQFIRDGISLTLNTDQSRVAKGLAGYVTNFRSWQSYSSVALNEVGDVFLSAIQYICLLQEIFPIKQEVIQGLKHETVRAVIEKLGIKSTYFISDDLRGAFQEMLQKIEIKKGYPFSIGSNMELSLGRPQQTL